MSTTTQYQYLAPNPKSSYRQLFVKGRRIAARTLYGLYASEEPMTVAQIAADYNVPVEAVQEAIAYCESDPPELSRDYALDAAFMEAMGMNDPDYRQHGKSRRLAPQEIAQILRAYQ